MDKNPRDYHYHDILALKHTKPIAFQEWQTAMEAEIQALNDRNVWELVDLPINGHGQRLPTRRDDYVSKFLRDNMKWMANPATDG